MLKATLSGPGWASILTGVWADVHGVRGDGGLEDNSFKARVPTLFNYVGRLAPELHSYAFTDWWPLSAFVKHEEQGE